MNEIVTITPWNAWPLAIPAVIAIGYTSPTFMGEVVQAPGEPGVTAFQAQRDGQRVRGVIKSLGGDQWVVAEIEETDP